MRAIIYVAGPLSKGGLASNVYNATKAANDLADLGFTPFLPHLTYLWHLIFQRPYEFWLEYDKVFLRLCGGVLRLPGESNGADQEVALAKYLGIPVFSSIEEVNKFFSGDKEGEYAR